MTSNFTAFIHERLQQRVDHARDLAISSHDKEPYRRAFTELENEASQIKGLYFDYLNMIKVLRDHTHEWDDDPASDHRCIVCGILPKETT